MSDSVVDKTELISRLADETGLNRTAVTTILDRLVVEISRRVRDGETVRIMGFGKFERRFRQSRNTTHPATGEAIVSASKWYPAFVAGKRFKDMVNDA